MGNFDSVYELTADESEGEPRYFFISKGTADVIKVIQFSFVQKLYGKQVYNLGFGDFDLENNSITDSANTNNGDAYKVFNTVLHTIPAFFKTYPNAMVMVQGSDSSQEFMAGCRLTCTKKCNDICKNFNRRINIYRKYVDKNFVELNIDYQFFGGNRNPKGIIAIEEYIVGKEYDSVFLQINIA